MTHNETFFHQTDKEHVDCPIQRRKDKVCNQVNIRLQPTINDKR